MARLEVISSFPVQDCGRPALLFVHGAFTAAWCWREHFLDYFAAAGWASYALSLSGHGGSSSARPLDRLGITDYVADLASTVAALTRPLVLVGHSMGGFVVQKYLERQPPQDAVRGAVLLASVPPQGLMAASLSLMFARPDLFIDLNRLMCGHLPAVDRLRVALFAQPIDDERLRRYALWAQPESWRALWDMALDLPQPARVLAQLAPSKIKGKR